MKKPICILLIILFLHLSFDIGHLSFASEYVLGPSDQLEINIIGHKDLDTKQTITPDGQISLPILGIILVQGQTLKSLQKYLTDSYSTYVEKPQITINLTPRPIYVVQYDLKKDIWEVKSAKSVDEANAFLGGATASNVETGLVPVRDIEHGNVYKVNMGTKPDFWEANWYKIITATAVIVGIYSTIKR